jgi:sec-independent protein translocase protein TatA
MINNILLLPLGATEIILIIAVILLLFGGKKIPELMRGLGRGVKEFKEGKESDTASDTATPKDPERRDV